MIDRLNMKRLGLFLNNIRMCALLLALSGLATGCQPPEAGVDLDPENNANFDPSEFEFKDVEVQVVDEEGKAVAGVSIRPTALRGSSGLASASAYGWLTSIYGAPEESMTDENGKAQVRYPVEGIPIDGEKTGALVLWVKHPEYGVEYVQNYLVNGLNAPIRLTPGVGLRVSGYFGLDKQPVAELAAQIDESGSSEGWSRNSAGELVLKTMTPGPRLLRLMGRLPSGEVGYSDPFGFVAEAGKEHHFELEIRAGVRVEGRLDDAVARPVANGRVLICVWPEEVPASRVKYTWHSLFVKHPNVRPWHSYRPIKTDGTFVFESVPRGGMYLFVHGEGFASRAGGRFRHGPNSSSALPQRFEIRPPLEEIEVATEPTGILAVTARTRWGFPVKGAIVSVSPSVLRMATGSFGFVRESSEALFREVEPLPDLVFDAISDEVGQAVIPNIPYSPERFYVDHPKLMPVDSLNGTDKRIDFVSGVTNRFKVTLVRK